MRCLVVGTDRLGSAPKILKQRFGVNEVIHWDGRKKPRCDLSNLSMILIYTGFVNHAAMQKAKKIAKQHNIKVVYIHRGLSELSHACKGV